MKKYKSLLIVSIVCGILEIIGARFLTLSLFNKIMEFNVKKGLPLEPLMAATANWAIIGSIISKYIMWLPAAIWIYRDSKKNSFYPWLWLIVVLLLNFKGIILYFLIQLLSQKELKTEN